jgi:hypothetical protein
MTTEFYLKGIYPVEVISGAQDGFVEVRAKTTFLHTSAYSEGKRQVKVGVTQKRWVRKGEVLKVPFRHVWSHRRSVAKGFSMPSKKQKPNQ